MTSTWNDRSRPLCPSPWQSRVLVSLLTHKPWIAITPSHSHWDCPLRQGLGLPFSTRPRYLRIFTAKSVGATAPVGMREHEATNTRISPPPPNAIVQSPSILPKRPTRLPVILHSLGIQDTRPTNTPFPTRRPSPTPKQGFPPITIVLPSTKLLKRPPLCSIPSGGV